MIYLGAGKEGGREGKETRSIPVNAKIYLHATLAIPGDLHFPNRERADQERME